jgi:hypothetical protein
VLRRTFIHLISTIIESHSGDDATKEWNQSDALFIQFIENQRPLHVSSITCSSSEGAAQTAFGILRTCYDSWLWHRCSFTATVPQRNIPNSVCVAPPENKQVTLEKCRGLWFSMNWMKSASRWFHYTDIRTMTHGQQNIKILYHLQCNNYHERKYGVSNKICSVTFQNPWLYSSTTVGPSDLVRTKMFVKHKQWKLFIHNCQEQQRSR